MKTPLTEEEEKEIERLLKLRNSTYMDNKSCFSLLYKIDGVRQPYCLTCGPSIRKMFNRLSYKYDLYKKDMKK
jgi:hypothetical protein